MSTHTITPAPDRAALAPLAAWLATLPRASWLDAIGDVAQALTRQAYVDAVAAERGNVSAAARALGCNVRSLQRAIEAHGLGTELRRMATAQGWPTRTERCRDAARRERPGRRC